MNLNQLLQPNTSFKPILALSISILLLSCSDTHQQPEINYHTTPPPERGGTLVSAMIGEPSTLIPMIAGESAASEIAAQLFNTLLTYDANLDLKGQLVSTWEVSDDNKTITFHLKPDLEWADGKPLTSNDVLFTWELVTAETTQSPYTADFQLVKTATAPDISTFVVEYAQPYAPALNSWASLEVLPKHLLEGKDIHTAAFGQRPVGSHYYQLDKWQHGEYLRLTRNPKSVLGPAHIDNRVSRIIPDRSAQFLELMADNIDLMGLDPIKYSRVIPARPELKSQLNLYKALGNAYTYLGFNLKRKPFDDLRVRQAINYAIDKQEIIDGVYLGLGINIASPYKPGTRWSNPELRPYPYDPDKAKALLAEAGFKDNNQDGWIERDGEPFEIEIITNQNKEREKSALLIQRRLKAIGIKVTFRALEWASFISNYIKKKDFDVVILGWQLGLDPDQYNIWHSSQQDPGQFNFVGYENALVDQLLEQGRTELDPDKRQRIYHQFAKQLLADSPIVYLSAGYELSAIHQRVKGIQDPAPPAGVGYDDQEWYIPKPFRRRNQMSSQ